MEPLAIVEKYVDAGLAPWRSKGFTVERSESGSRYWEEFRIRTAVLPRLVCVVAIDGLTFPLREDEAAHYIGTQVFSFYRNRPALPVDDHVILGEN